MLIAPILWHMYSNKEDTWPISPSLHCLFHSLFGRPLWEGRWQLSRKSCLMVFGVGGLSCGCCSLAGWCVTDSRRSLVSSPTYPACLARLARISLWSVTAILDGSRYSWKTCGERTPLTKVVHPSIHFYTSFLLHLLRRLFLKSHFVIKRTNSNNSWQT